MPSPSVSTFTFPSTTEPVFTASTSEPVFESPNHSQTSQTTQSQQLQQYHTTTVSNNNAKFPYLKKEEYKTWAMKMEYWIINSDHNLWNIVLNGNSRKRTGRDPKGNIMILPPVSVEEHIAVQRETKVWRFQKILSQLNQMQAKPDNEDCNMKFLRALPHSWSQVAITLKTKGGNVHENSISKARYSSFKLKELDKTKELKALLSVDSMLNWSDLEGEDVENGVAQVYGMIAGDEEDVCLVVALDLETLLDQMRCLISLPLHFDSSPKDGFAEILSLTVTSPQDSESTGLNLIRIEIERNCDSGYSRCMTGSSKTTDEIVGGSQRNGLAHVELKNLNKLAKHGLVNGLPSKLFTNEHNYVACNKGKQHKASYKAITAVSTISAPLQLLHMDLFGPTSIRSIDHKYYSLVVTDDFSRFTWGIRRDYSNARTPQQNGVAERKNRTLIEAARTMLADSKLPTMFWIEAVSTACYVLNRVLGFWVDGVGPKDHAVSDLVESSSDYAEELARLKKQAYEANATAEKHLSLADLAASRNRVPAGMRDFPAGMSDGPTETSTPVVNPVHTDGPSLPPEIEDIHHHPDTGIFSSSSYDDDFGGTITNLAPSVVVDSGILIRGNHYIHSQILEDLNSPVQTETILHCLLLVFLSNLNKRSVFVYFGLQALNDPAWIEAMQEEMQQFVNQEVWQLVPLPDGKIAIVTKWILKNKRDARGIVVRNKARLVAQGHRQEEGIDYDEVFAPVARIEWMSRVLSFMGKLKKKVCEALYGLHLAPWDLVMQDCILLAVKAITEEENLRMSAMGELHFFLAYNVKQKLWDLYSSKAKPPKLEVLVNPRDSPFVLEAYSDSDYAGSHGDRKSTTGGCQFLGRRLISWQCKKQTIVATFSTEAEYVACCNCSVSFLVLQEFLLVALLVPTDRTIPTGLFWSTASLRASKEGPPAILATIDRTPYTITESLVRSQLQLDDEGGVEDLPIADIYLGMDNLGYPSEGKLTFFKNKFSPQWRFLVHTIMHCLSTKSGSWDQFGSQLAIAIICLTGGRKYNWSSYIFKGMVNNINNPKKFLMFPRFLQMILEIEPRSTK
ncbi:putative ribonuclease H-like domain-containing protein [Tanacetum coccineum]|uniref:Ribonuclease H-like domain-containing protein n=1 Tax=Tanacetum coccineum TaxID=301880 RepID=A0ABQ5HMQ4_9ASTR